MIITGISGLLGNNLAVYFRDKYEILGLYHSNRVEIDGVMSLRADLKDANRLKRAIIDFNPDVIIHCASVTDIDKCEKERAKTYEVNVTGTKNIVNVIKDKEVYLIYISSDSVYDGVKGDCKESDKIAPQNYYGLTKYQGELEVLKHRNIIIYRTNIFGWNIQDKNSLGEWVLNELHNKKTINGFKDAYFSSIYTMEFARILDISLTKEIKGIYNCGSRDHCSKYEFLKKIADQFDISDAKITPISIDEFTFIAKRGKILTLNVGKLEKSIEYKLPNINNSITSFYKDYKCGFPERIKRKKSQKSDKKLQIPYGRHWIDNTDIDSVKEVLQSERITQGPKVEEFENELSKYCDAQYAVAVNSGTSALHIACLAADIKNGDEVITSPITFVASANCAVYCGAKPVFADIDKLTYNIDPSEIEKKITKNTKAVVPVHFAGQSCDMATIYDIVQNAEKKYGNKIYIIEDACHALGSKYKETPVGSCVYSDMAVMSFHPVKHITTGEGGAVLTNDEALYKKLRRFRSHGITNSPEEFVNKELAFSYHNSQFENYDSPNPWYYEQVDLGYNYRITDIQCALGLSQLNKINAFRERRRKIVDEYNSIFKNIKTIHTPFELEDCDSNFHLYILLFDFEQIGIERAKFMNELKLRGIQTQVHYIPVHTQPFFQKNFNTKWGDCRKAEQYYQKCLSLPLYPVMVELDVERVVREITCLVRKK